MDCRTVKEEYEGLYLNSLMENRTRDIIANHVENEEDKPLFLYIPSLTVHFDNDGYYAPEQVEYWSFKAMVDRAAFVLYYVRIVQRTTNSIYKVGIDCDRLYNL